MVAENNLKLIDATNDLYADVTSSGSDSYRNENKRDEALTTIKTYYEKKFSDLGFKICYLKFQL